jgi:hypothetical protein
MKRKLLVLLFAALLVSPAMFAQELPNVFPLFLVKLVERHEIIGTLSMPSVEVLTAPGYENEAVYMTSFKNPQDAITFLSVLKKENIPMLTFPNDELRIGLFHSDLLAFIMKAAIGL